MVKSGNKACIKCWATKPVSAFVVDTRYSDGYSSRCRVCAEAEDLLYTARAKAKAHDKAEKKVRGVYDNMIRQCYNKTSKRYKRYGGRGITVCAEWLDNREAFVQWYVGQLAAYTGDKSKAQINSIDNDNGDYSPANCRLVSSATNIQNSTLAKLNVEKVAEIRALYATGQYTQTELGAMFGVTPVSIHAIVHHKAWK